MEKTREISRGFASHFQRGAKDWWMINDWLFPDIENFHHAMYEEENKRKK